MPTTAVPPILTSLVAGLAEAVPRRARTTFTELLLGAATTRGGHVTDAILAAGLSRSWTSYYWFLQRGRWAWLAVWRALLGALQELFAPPVWRVVIDDTVVERISSRAPGSLVHHNHAAKPNRSRFLRGQGWLCLAAVAERGWRVGAVPLMLRLVRRGTHRGKLVGARFLVRLLGRRLGRVRLLLDAWFMRARLIEAALAGGHTVIGRARRDLALYAVPRPPWRRRPGRPRKYGPRMTPERVGALPVHRSARILYGRFEVVRYRSCRVAARFLKGRVVRAVWVRLERPDRPGEERLLLCTDPALPATEVVTSYAKRWSVEIVFTQMTKRHPLAGRAERDGVADLDLAVGDQHAVDQQLHELPLAREVGAGQARPNPPAEVGGRGRPAGELGPPVHLRLQLIGLPAQRLEPLLQRLSAALVLGQRDGGEQVRLGQAFQLPLEGEPAPARLLAPGLQLLRQPAAAVRARQRLGDRPRLGEQLAQVPPDEIVEPVRRRVARPPG